MWLGGLQLREAFDGNSRSFARQTSASGWSQPIRRREFCLHTTWRTHVNRLPKKNATGRKYRLGTGWTILYLRIAKKCNSGANAEPKSPRAPR